MNMKALHNLNPEKQDADSLRREVNGAAFVAYSSPRPFYESEVQT